MSAESHPTPLGDQLRGAFDWWREAGVDYAFADEARSWLDRKPASDTSGETTAPTGWEPREAPPPSALANRAPAATPAAPAIGGPRESWPDDLAAFAAWWLAEPSLAPPTGSARAAPNGPAQAELMVLMAEPVAAGELLPEPSPEGRLVAAMLKAMGIPANRVYTASALPAPLVGADWMELGQSGLAALTAHHVALVQPRRLIAFGSNLWPLLWHEPAQAGPNLRIFNHESGTVPVLAAPALERLVRRPADRRRLWQDWLEWTAGDGSA